MKANAAALLFAVLSMACAAPEPDFQSDNPRSLLGKPAPKLSVQNWLNTGGKALSLESLRGKVVVLDFWAFW